MASAFEIWKIHMRHRIHHDQEVIAYGTGNLNREVIGTGFLFYDYDNGTVEQYRALLEQFGKWYGNNFFALKTKHGVACVSMIPEDFEHIHDRFMLLKEKFTSDYLYDIPLFLRVSEKWGLDGKVVSPMPQILFNPSATNVWEFLSKKCLPKKWYHTYD